MTQTLQEALLKAGLVTKEKLAKAEADKKAAERAQRQGARPQPPKKQTARSTGRVTPSGPCGTRPPSAFSDSPRGLQEPPRPLTPQKKPLGFIEGKHHHHSRTDCEACGRNSPDVEYYEHKNKSLDKYWLCVRCADDNNVHDDFRQTMQSPQAMKGLFQRGYGPTKVFKKR